MNSILIKHINDTQKKMGAYLSLLDLRYRNLCVKADPMSLLPVTVNADNEHLNLEDVARVSMPNEFQLAVYPNVPNYVQDIIRGIFEAHPEFRLEMGDMNEDRKRREEAQKEEGPDTSQLGIDDVFDEDSDETKYLLYTMPEVNKDRRDFLDNGVTALHQQCIVRLDAEYAEGLKKLSEAEMYSTPKDMDEARQDMKDILDDVKEKVDKLLDDKQQEIEEAYRHYLENPDNAPAPTPAPAAPKYKPYSDEPEQEPGYDVTKGYRVS